MTLPLQLPIRGPISAPGRVAPTNLPFSVTITVMGANAVATDLYTVVAVTPALARAVVETSGALMANLAKEIHRPHIDTGVTYDSIMALDAVESAGSIYIDVVAGTPNTPQARLLEYGFLHEPSGDFIQYPFMIPASDSIAPIFESAMVRVVEVLLNRSRNSVAAGPSFNSALSGARSSLYSLSRFLGDVRIFFPEFGASIRQGALTTAQLLGDTQAIMRDAIGTRITRRIEGRAITSVRSQSVTISGPDSDYTSAANRIYNRIAGRQAGEALRYGDL